MNILVIGSRRDEQECREKFGLVHIYILATNHVDATIGLATADVIFDFTVSDDATYLKVFERPLKAGIFLNTSFTTLAVQLHKSKIESSNLFVGFCGLPTFLDRPLLELSLMSRLDEMAIKQVCANLKTEFVLVDDRVGLVTPRVICMVINEAYYTVQEGTATREDVDLAMKLGTNYPFGPFEWCEKIGIKNVYNLLSAVYEDTKDERYKICVLLKKGNT